MTKAQARRLLERYRADPVLFSHEVLGFKTWPRQAELIRSVAQHRRVACRSGQKTGKSASAAVVAHWWTQTMPRARVVFTAPTHPQVEKILWPEFCRRYRDTRIPLGGELFRDLSKGLQLPNDREVFCRTAREPDTFQGLSGDNILFIVDEASGFPEPIFDAVFGNMAGGGRVLLLGNPTQTSGTFYDAFHDKREAWHTIHISSLESPNFHGGRVPGLASPQWLADMRVQWGEGSAAWQVRIDGEFPKQGSNAVIGLDVAEAAKLREAIAIEAKQRPTGIFRIGVDVARYGDDSSVIRGLRGNRVLPPMRMHGANTQEIAGAILVYVREHRVNPAERPSCKIDEIGIGAGVVDALGFEHQEVEVFGINVAAKATAPDFHDLRSQLWFACADWLAEGGTIDDDRTLAELIAPTYTFDAQGRRVVESKDAIKKRLKRSPDDADALCLAVFDPPRVDWTVGGVTSTDRAFGVVGGSRAFAR